MLLRQLRPPLAGLVLLLIVGAVAISCAEDKKTTPSLTDAPRQDAKAPIVVPAGAPVVLGVSMPLTGPVQSGGEENRDAIVLAVERWKEAHGDLLKGHEIEVRVEDDGCFESDIAAQAAERLLRAPGLVGVVGPSCSAGAQDAIPVYARAGIVSISPTVTATSLTSDQPPGGFFFRTSYRNDLTGTFVGVFASNVLESQSAYLIDDGEEYGLNLADAAERAMEDSGVTVTRASIEIGEVDFSELAATITQEAPAFVGFAGFNPEAALLYRQLRDAGYGGLFGAGDAAASEIDFVEPVGPEAEGALFAGCPLSLPEDFHAKFEELHEHAPQASSFVAQSADAATILLNAVAEVAQEQTDGSLVIDPLELRDAVRASALEDGISGAIAFDENGDRIPPGVESLQQFVDDAVARQDTSGYLNLGLIPCQVQDGRLVNLLGPGAGEIRLP